MAHETVLIVGGHDQRLLQFLHKFGLKVQRSDGEAGVKEALNTEVIDLVMMDMRAQEDYSVWSDLLKNHDKTKGVPLVLLSKEGFEATARSVAAEHGQAEIVSAAASPGVLVARIATMLRMRKMAGGRDDGKANLAEVNANLRDMTERMRKDLEDAKSIQEALLPRNLPSDSNWSIGYDYRPLSEVGGDWYYVDRLDGDRLLLQVADVTGHGLAAAFIGSMSRLALNVALRNKKAGPVDLVSELNTLLSPVMPEGRFITMILGIYDTKSGELRYSSAGHPPLLHYQAKNGTVGRSAGKGLAVGFLEDAIFQELSLTLEPGDSVAIYSDGIVEAKNRTLAMYGTEMLEASLQNRGKEPDGAAIAKGVIQDFDGFMDGRLLRDDLTLLVLKRSA